MWGRPLEARNLSSLQESQGCRRLTDPMRCDLQGARPKKDYVLTLTLRLNPGALIRAIQFIFISIHFFLPPTQLKGFFSESQSVPASSYTPTPTPVLPLLRRHPSSPPSDHYCRPYPWSCPDPESCSGLACRPCCSSHLMHSHRHLRLRHRRRRVPVPSHYNGGPVAAPAGSVAPAKGVQSRMRQQVLRPKRICFLVLHSSLYSNSSSCSLLQVLHFSS